MEKKNPITKISDVLCSIEMTVTWIAFALMLALLLIQVFCRYVFDLPLAWAEEMVRYVYVGVSFTGAIVAVRQESHIQIDVIPIILQKFVKDPIREKRIENILEIIACIIAAIFMAVLSVWLVQYNIELKELGQFTVANEWPMWIMCLPLSISVVLMCLHYVLLVLEKLIKARELRKGVA